jgi:hypothetical protein
MFDSQEGKKKRKKEGGWSCSVFFSLFFHPFSLLKDLFYIFIQRTTFRGALELSPVLKISVWAFTKCNMMKFPSLKQISDVAMQVPITPIITIIN